MKKTKALVFLLFAVLIIVLFIFFLMDQKKEKKEYSCENLKDSLEKDICYRDLNLDEEIIDILKLPDSFSKENCYKIENPYVQYMCLRLGFRPHMQSFISTKTVSINFKNIVSVCNKYDDYHALYCTYLQAAKLAVVDINKSKDICNNIQDTKLKGECMFYIASAYAMNIAEDTDNKVQFLMNFCSEVEYPSWKSECYYVLADELALLKDENYLDEINAACTGSSSAHDYSCFGHVTFLMNFENVEEYCILVTQFGKADCYKGMGEVTGVIEGIEKGIEKCKIQIPAYREACFEGLSRSIDFNFTGIITKDAEKCSNYASELTSWCFDNLINYVSFSFYDDLPKAISECNKLPSKFITFCFNKLKTDKNKCNQFEDGLNEDVCYWGYNLALHKISNQYKEENCNFIENTYLRYVCFRVGYRPHMFDFITEEYSVLIFNSSVQECNKYDDYHALYCTYLQAAKLAVVDINKSKDICNNIQDTKLKGECMFYIASAYAMNIAEDTDNKVEFLMNFCSEVEYPSWKSECYYVLADELALLKDENYLDEINAACTGSSSAHDYLCFHHVTLFMPINRIPNFCDLADNRFIDGCYAGLGASSGLYFTDNISQAVETCSKLKFEYKEACLEGLAEYIGNRLIDDVDLVIEKCRELPSKHQEFCFRWLTDTLGIRLDNINLIIEKCNEFPAEYRDYCLDNLQK